MIKIALFFVLFTFTLSFSSFSQSATDLLGEWKLHFSLSDGTELKEQNVTSFVNNFVQSDKEDKQKFGEEFTPDDSIKSYNENYNGLQVFLNLDFTFKPNNLCQVKTLIEDTLQKKDAKYKYHADTKIVEVLNDQGEVYFSFLLKKEENTVHMYFDGDNPFSLLNMMGGKVYLWKVKVK